MSSQAIRFIYLLAEIEISQSIISNKTNHTARAIKWPRNRFADVDDVDYCFMS